MVAFFVFSREFSFISICCLLVNDIKLLSDLVFDLVFINLLISNIL